MQRTLGKLVAWANGWQIDFNINKCGVMHIEERKLDLQYQMNDGWVKSLDEERDIGMLMYENLKFSKQCLLAKNKS